MPIANEAIRAHFFRRNGINKTDDIEACFKVIRDRYPDCGIRALKAQGGCSYTVVVARDGNGRGKEDEDVGSVIVQFRLLEHAVKREIALDVRRVFGKLAPEALWFEEFHIKKGVVLQICGMSRVRGVGFSSLQPRCRRLSSSDFERLRGLIDDIAVFFAMSWRAARSRTEGNNTKGKVESSIRQRLVKLENELPTTWLQSRAARMRKAFDAGFLDCLPIVLNHGDLLPSNVMVDRGSWRLTGLVDWAEAEYLPFGMALYGIEHLLGFFETERRTFVYYDQANELRHVFWRRLRVKIPGLLDRDPWRAVVLSREIGILLWHGIAWDEGRLDRVVNCQDDIEELAYLESFLKGSQGSRIVKL